MVERRKHLFFTRTLVVREEEEEESKYKLKRIRMKIITQ